MALLLVIATFYYHAGNKASFAATGGGASAVTAVENATVPANTPLATNIIAVCPCSATVDWGDGGPVAGATVVANGPNWDVVSSTNHIYSEEGSFTTTIVFSDTGAPDTLTGTATVSDAPLSFVNTALGAMTENIGATFTVGTLTDANSAGIVADFTSIIVNWGDGSPAGTGTLVATGGGTFKLNATHTYADEGAFNVSGTITDTGGSTVNITNNPIVVADAPLSLTATPSSFVEGTNFNGALAVLTDANSAATCADFVSSITWSDGAITPGGCTGTGPFNVTGTHTYLEEGSYAISISVTDDGGKTATVNNPSIASNAALTLTGAIGFNPDEGAAITSFPLVTFTDADPAGVIGDYTATIDWSDGSPLDVGVITGTGPWTVSGSHTYTEEAARSIKVVVSDSADISTVFVPVTINDALLSLTPRAAMTANEGVPVLNTIVGTFTDLDPGGIATDYSAKVNWGDGTPADTAVVSGTGPWTTAVPSHTFPVAGSYTAQIILKDNTFSTSATFGVTVNDMPLAISTKSVSVLEGTIFTGRVATILDGNATPSCSDYSSITIDWGDATPIDVGTCGAIAGGNVDVNGSHTYAEEGSYSITVAVTDVGGSSGSNTGPPSVITDGNLSLTPLAGVSAPEGVINAMNLFSLSDTATSGTASDFTVTVDWGDGSGFLPASLSTDPGPWTVTASHAYSEEGNFTVTVRAVDVGGQIITNSRLLTVTASNLSVTAGSNIVVAEGSNTGNVTLATFTDLDVNGILGDYSASIDWGDGSPIGTGVISGSGPWTVTGNHTYTTAGLRTVIVAVNDSGGGSGSNTLSATANDGALVVTAEPNVAPNEGALWNSTIATFTDASATATCANFSSISIVWGDGSPNGTGICAGPVGGPFVVTASHTWSEESLPTFTVTVTDSGGSSGSDSHAALVLDAALTLNVSNQTASEGSSLNTTWATLTDSNAGATCADFSSIIAFNDTTPNGALTCAPLGGGVFSLSTSHTYSEEGSYGIAITVTDVGGSTITDASRSTTVNDANLTGVNGANINLIENSSTGSITLGSFTDIDPGGVNTDFTASIDWGDGSLPTIGSIVGVGNGPWTVRGNHTYLDEGNFVVTATVADSGGAVTVITVNATIADAALTSSPAAPWASIEGVSKSATLGSFTDANLASTCSDFTLNSDYGDATPLSTPTCTKTGPGNFIISDTHTTPEEAVNTITVSVTDVGGSTTSFTLTNNASDGAIAVVGTLATVNEGVNTVIVATLTDTDTLGGCADFTTVFSWGDGTGNGGICSGGGPYSITAAHTYSEKGTYSVTVSAVDVGGAVSSNIFSVSVLDAPLSVTPVANITKPENSAISPQVLATFTDLDSAGTLTDYTASIDWGDNSGSMNATVTGSGPWSITGGHTYSDAGNYTVTVTAIDVDGASQTATLLAMVGEGTLTVTANNISATSNTAFSGIVGSGNDSSGIEPSADYGALINWGDGSTSPASISSGSSSILVSGTHTYTAGGNYSLSITFSEIAGGSVLSATAIASVTDGNTPFTKGESKPDMPAGLIVLFILGLALVLSPLGKGAARLRKKLKSI